MWMVEPNSFAYPEFLCPNCNTRNRPSANFCDHCGSALRLECAHCGTKNRFGANFCDHCGSRLEESGAASAPLPEQSGRPVPADPPPAPKESPQTALARHIPKDFAAKLENARSQGAMIGERRIVTFLFCDIAGSTAAASQMDPEEWAAIIHEVFELMIDPIYEYEGIVARLMGDSILAFFGAPIAHEDDPQRAILAGLKISSDMQSYVERLKRQRSVEINVRVGINTGLVMVGQVGSDLQMEYTALGDAINIAARMEQTAQPGTVQVSEDTYRLARAVFHFEELGEVRVKGKSEAIHTYRPVREKARRGSLRGLEGVRSALVGRQDEYELLLSAVQQLERGVGKILFLVGEAGLGKSRLVSEVKEAAGRSGPENTPDPAETPLAWYDSASLSYETGTPYGLFRRLFRSLWEISINDEKGVVREKIASNLEKYPLPGRPQLQLIFEALLGKGSDLDAQSIGGETFKRGLFEAAIRIWEYEAARKPVILVFDDLHWSDPASVELLLQLVQLTDRAPLMIICALRFDPDSPGWKAKGELETHWPHRFIEIRLNPLSPQESEVLVDELLDIVDLPAALRRSILNKTDGNPFFIEEVLRALIERGVVIPAEGGDHSPLSTRWKMAKNTDEIDIPVNLFTLLSARIDRLDENARRILQLASVIGRSFYYRILQTIHQNSLPASDGLEHELLILQQAQLIREAARLPELEYIFRHSLTQEAAYQTILHKQRREFHARVGEAIENLFAERQEEFYPVLAHHFGEAGDPRALRYELLSGDSAFRLYAISEALAHYEHALSLAKKANPSPSPETWIHLYTRRGRAFELQNSYPDAVQTYDELYHLGLEAEDLRIQLAALVAHATAVAIPTPVQDSQKAEELSQKALSLARQLGDREAEAKILWNFMLLNNYSGHMRLGIPYGESSVELARQYSLTEQLAHSLQDLTLAYMGFGRLEDCRQALEESRSLWKELGNLPMLSENLANSSLYHTLTGSLSEAFACYQEGHQISQQIGNEWGKANNSIFIGDTYLAWGEYDLALQTIHSVITVARRLGHPGFILCQVQLAELYGRLGASERARDSAQEAVQESQIFPPFQPVALACLAKFDLRIGDLPSAIRHIEEALKAGYSETLINNDIYTLCTQIEVLLAQNEDAEAQQRLEALLKKVREAGARFYLPEALSLHARWCAGRGDLQQARQDLQEARSISAEMGAIDFEWRLLALQAVLESGAGAEAQAGLLRREAAGMVESIAARSLEPEIRAGLSELAAKLLQPDN
jgi:class 3 adenylate cyclase